MTSLINLSEQIPLIDVNDIAVEVVGIIAQRKKGKTYTGTKLFEELFHADVQCVAIDQVGNWHYLRNSSTGKSSGLPICVFGGLNGDLAITPEAGKLMANVVVKHHVSCVIDVSQFRKGERIKFCKDFCEELFYLKKSKNTPLHLFLEEVHKIAPQKPGPDELGMLGAVEDIVRLGRNFGIGCTLLDQRPASVNKEILTQVSILLVGSIIHNLDRKAIEDWIVNHANLAGDGGAKKYLEQLPGLDKKEKFFWYPEKKIFKKITISKKSTFDGSATPRAGEGPVSSRVKTVPFDKEEMAELTKAMAEISEEVKASDPKALKAQVAELKRQLAKATTSQVVTTPAPPPPPTISKATIDRFDNIVDRYMTKLQLAGDAFREGAEKLDQVRDRAAQAQQVLVSEFGSLKTELERMRTPVTKPKTFFLNEQHTTHEAKKAKGDHIQRFDASEAHVPGSKKLDKCDRAIIAALWVFSPTAMTRQHISIYTGYRNGSGGFNNAMSRLTSGGLIVRVEDRVNNGYELTTIGRGADVGGNDGLGLKRTTRQLLDLWKPKFDGKAKDILEFMVDKVGASSRNKVTREQIAQEVGMALGSGGFNNYMSALTSAGLIQKSPGHLYMAAEEFYL